MALQTPRARTGLQRPSYGHTTSSSPNLSARAAVDRKASLQALTGQTPTTTPRTPVARMDADLEVGDLVNVPGDMYGVVRFVGSVRGKAGRFVGVELDREFAQRGKNDGDVDGTSYFITSVPGAGIFLPVHRAEKRTSPNTTVSADSGPLTPNTPSHGTLRGLPLETAHTPPTPAFPHKFSQTVGPGVRPSSPSLKPHRPSLPRPESPFRKQPPALAPTPARSLSQSQRGLRPGATPGKSHIFKTSTNIRPPASTTPRPYSRNSSRLGSRADPEEDRTPVGVAVTGAAARVASMGSAAPSQPLRSTSRLGSAGGSSATSDTEIRRLTAQLAERDRRLDEQAASLAEMEASVKELSAIIPGAEAGDLGTPGTRTPSGGGDDAHTAAQLRQLVREKNEKIGLLTAEFDAHRADFRSTLDSLEMASTETERVYEEQKRDLLAQLAALQDVSQSKEDFEGVAQQLKQLEDLVAELEDGLEESRRGEAEARGEVEFLRGEVERGRSELKREREKAAAAKASGRDLEAKDDEISGLKAIIHGLSATASPTTTSRPASGVNGNGALADADELHRLRRAVETGQKDREALEDELEQIRRALASTNGAYHTRTESDRTATAAAPDSSSPLARRPRGDTIKATFAERAGAANGTTSYCEMCESANHDTLECTNFTAAAGRHPEARPTLHQANGTNGKSAGSFLLDDDEENDGRAGAGAGGATSRDELHVRPPQLANTNAYPSAKTNGDGDVGAELERNRKSEESHPQANQGAGDEDKWCALCEKDGHLAFDCPEEQY